MEIVVLAIICSTITSVISGFIVASKKDAVIRDLEAANLKLQQRAISAEVKRDLLKIPEQNPAPVKRRMFSAKTDGPKKPVKPAKPLSPVKPAKPSRRRSSGYSNSDGGVMGIVTSMGSFFDSDDSRNSSSHSNSHSSYDSGSSSSYDSSSSSSYDGGSY